MFQVHVLDVRPRKKPSITQLSAQDKHHGQNSQSTLRDKKKKKKKKNIQGRRGKCDAVKNGNGNSESCYCLTCNEDEIKDVR